jgi:hypothetical protein
MNRVRGHECVEECSFIIQSFAFASLNLVGGINGESVKKNVPDNSALLGVIWQAPWQNVSFDAGLRRGMSNAAADWMFTTGLTFSFSLASILTN